MGRVLSILLCLILPACGERSVAETDGSPSLDLPATCTSNSQCGSDAFCERDGNCSGSGTCAPRPGACETIYAPVCGCDGQTHGNLCTAHSRGVSVASTGECAKRDTGPALVPDVFRPDLPTIPDQAVLLPDLGALTCAPTGQKSPCYSIFKSALLNCACTQGNPLPSCVPATGLYAQTLQLLATCVVQSCPNLCSSYGYDTFQTCAPTKCKALAECCYGDGA